MTRSVRLLALYQGTVAYTGQRVAESRMESPIGACHVAGSESREMAEKNRLETVAVIVLVPVTTPNVAVIMPSPAQSAWNRPGACITRGGAADRLLVTLLALPSESVICVL